MLKVKNSFSDFFKIVLVSVFFVSFQQQDTTKTDTTRLDSLKFPIIQLKDHTIEFKIQQMEIGIDSIYFYQEQILQLLQPE